MDGAVDGGQVLGSRALNRALLARQGLLELPAPVRLLEEYDDVLLGHADPSRIVPAGFPWGAMLAHGRMVDTVLVDGMLRGTWWVERPGGDPATLGLRPWPELEPDERAAVAEEAGRAVRFLAPDAPAHDLRFEPAPA